MLAEAVQHQQRAADTRAQEVQRELDLVVREVLDLRGHGSHAAPTKSRTISATSAGCSMCTK